MQTDSPAVAGVKTTPNSERSSSSLPNSHIEAQDLESGTSESVTADLDGNAEIVVPEPTLPVLPRAGDEVAPAVLRSEIPDSEDLPSSSPVSPSPIEAEIGVQESGDVQGSVVVGGRVGQEALLKDELPLESIVPAGEDALEEVRVDSVGSPKDQESETQRSEQRSGSKCEDSSAMVEVTGSKPIENGSSASNGLKKDPDDISGEDLEEPAAGEVQQGTIKDEDFKETSETFLDSLNKPLLAKDEDDIANASSPAYESVSKTVLSSEQIAVAGKEKENPQKSAPDEDTLMNDIPSSPIAAEKIGTATKVPGEATKATPSQPSSQDKKVLLTELKAMKMASIRARNTALVAEIAAKRAKLEEVKKELKHPAAETVKQHIKLLHDYNDIRDVGQGLVGMIADNRGVRIGELYGEFGVGLKD